MQWWRRRTAKQTSMQLALATNLTVSGNSDMLTWNERRESDVLQHYMYSTHALQIAAVGLPIAYNYVAKGKVAEQQERRAELQQKREFENEQLAIKVLVNERRREQGLEAAVFADEEAVEHATVAAAGELFDQVTKIHKQQRESEAAGMAASRRSPSLPVMASPEFVASSRTAMQSAGQAAVPTPGAADCGC